MITEYPGRLGHDVKILIATSIFAAVLYACILIFTNTFRWADVLLIIIFLIYAAIMWYQNTIHKIIINKSDKTVTIVPGNRIRNIDNINAIEVKRCSNGTIICLTLKFDKYERIKIYPGEPNLFINDIIMLGKAIKIEDK